MKNPDYGLYSNGWAEKTTGSNAEAVRASIPRPRSRAVSTRTPGLPVRAPPSGPRSPGSLKKAEGHIVCGLEQHRLGLAFIQDNGNNAACGAGPLGRPPAWPRHRFASSAAPPLEAAAGCTRQVGHRLPSPGSGSTSGSGQGCRPGLAQVLSCPGCRKQQPETRTRGWCRVLRVRVRAVGDLVGPFAVSCESLPFSPLSLSFRGPLPPSLAVLSPPSTPCFFPALLSTVGTPVSWGRPLPVSSRPRAPPTRQYFVNPTPGTLIYLANCLLGKCFVNQISFLSERQGPHRGSCREVKGIHFQSIEPSLALPTPASCLRGSKFLDTGPRSARACGLQVSWACLTTCEISCPTTNLGANLPQPQSSRAIFT